MKIVLPLVAIVLFAACSPQEGTIDRFSACPGINSDFDFGPTPVVDGVDIVQKARPGRFVVEQVSGLLSTHGHQPERITHLLRTRDTCGEHDLIVFVEGGGLCAAVLGRDFSGVECLQGADLEAPAVFDVPTGDLIFGQALAVRVPLGTRHVVAGSGGRTIAAFPIDGWVLVVTQDGVDYLDVISTDLNVKRVELSS